MLKELLEHDLRQYSKKYTFATIKSKCSDFLKESQGHPLYKHYNGIPQSIQKIKIRHKKHELDIDSVINEALAPKLLDRSLITHTHKSAFDNVYVFPINEYKYVYTSDANKLVKYDEIYSQLIQEGVDSPETVVYDLLKLSCNTSNLIESFSYNNEVLMYNIPYYFTVSIEEYPEYNKLLEMLENK